MPPIHSLLLRLDGWLGLAGGLVRAPGRVPPDGQLEHQTGRDHIGAQPAQLPPGMAATLEATARFKSDTMIHWANATHACTCEVDVETGHVRLTRYIVSEDVGPMINPNVVEGQIAGGTVQGIGGALLENMVYDDAGNPLSSTFVDYLLPTATEVPPIEYGNVEIPGPGIGGYKGCGEGGAIGSTPAVINAVNDALAPLGVTLTRLPASPAAIVELIEQAGTGASGKDH